jgi:hypothetical protein
VEIIDLMDRSIYGCNLLEPVFHAAEWNQLDPFAHELAAEIVAESTVIEGGNLLTRRECEGNPLGVRRGVRVAQNIPVERKKFELAGLKLCEKLRIPSRHAVITRIDRNNKPPIGFLADSIPDLREKELQMTVLRL